jgi:Cytochrome P460
MIKAYTDGIPANGKPVPDGAMIAKIEWVKRHDTSPYGVTVPGPLAEVGFMVKDSKRFPQTNGWGYAKLTYDAASNTFTPLKIEMSNMRSLCHGCHVSGAKARDFVYTSYAQR